VSTDLRQAAADYLRLRRSLGYRLIDHDWLIEQFLDHLKARGNTRITVADALTFAQAPATTSRRWHAQRLAVIRGLAVHVRATDPRAAEVIPPDLIHGRLSRRIPYLYSPEQVRALMTGARTLRPPILAASVSTWVGLMAVTGMRTCEARCLDVQDLAVDGQVLAVTGKYGKRRLLPLHPSTVQQLLTYLRLRDGVASTPHAGPLLVGCRGGRLNKNTIQMAFRQIADAVGLAARPGTAAPRLYDLRHTFAVNSLIDAHRDGADIDARVAALATYLGHVEPANTYWYLTASPELMALVRERMSAHMYRPRR
jgi:integrase/recombinase XerD